jgi:hypothetical protein
MTAQWISANSRICDILAVTMSHSQLACYNEYTRQIGDLLQVYTEESVMLLDHEHRCHVSFTGRSWDEGCFCVSRGLVLLLNLKFHRMFKFQLSQQKSLLRHVLPIIRVLGVVMAILVVIGINAA